MLILYSSNFTLVNTTQEQGPECNGQSQLMCSVFIKLFVYLWTERKRSDQSHFRFMITFSFPLTRRHNLSLRDDDERQNKTTILIPSFLTKELEKEYKREDHLCSISVGKHWNIMGMVSC